MYKKWYIDEAIDIAKAIQPTAKKFGYHVTLGGGVLNKGYSNKDVDLFFLPINAFSGDGVERDHKGLLEYLTSIWGSFSNLLDYDDLPWAKESEPSLGYYKAAVKFFRNRTDRIDCFFF